MAATDKFSVWGTGEESRDLLYVDDLADFVRRAIERQKSTFEIYNCGSGRAGISYTKSWRLLLRSWLLSTIASLFLDFAKAERESGWRSAHSMEEGIAKTAAWWKENTGKA